MVHKWLINFLELGLLLSSVISVIIIHRASSDSPVGRTLAFKSEESMFESRARRNGPAAGDVKSDNRFSRG